MAALLLPISFITIGELVFVNRLQIFWEKAVLHLFQSFNTKPLVQLQAHVTLVYFDVERGSAASKLPAKSGGDHSGTPVFLLFGVV